MITQYIYIYTYVYIYIYLKSYDKMTLYIHIFCVNYNISLT